ncbi:MAG TPA: cell envelope integrity protein CreD [Candidatus Hydrogenedentes bacterium]|nr:cell envelope integrity protein CreD [Candidatus Hydrogenedentota bacterium]
MSANWIAGYIESIRTSPLVRVLLVGFLVLILQIPVAMIQEAIYERQSTRDEAVREVRAKWGGTQSLVGPSLVVPYTKRWTETLEDGQVRTRSVIQYATFLPELLEATGTIASESRNRGIFEVPVYNASLVLAGNFLKPNFSEWDIVEADVHWDEAYVSMGVSDARGITKETSLAWNGAPQDFLPGSGKWGRGVSGIHSPVKGGLTGERFSFSFPLELKGSEGLHFAPFGKKTVISLESDWPDPSFQGNWLPSERAVDETGFKVTWDIPFLGRNYPQAWLSESGTEGQVVASTFGVNLISPVDAYRMSQRSVKYAALFVALTFGVLWLFEVLGKRRIHPLQYLLVGAAMCAFYLLELSLSEHLGFATAYALASLAVILLVSAYCVAILRSLKRSAVVGTALAVLYTYLYVLLKNQDYALLIGSVGLFCVIAGTMYLTRKLDWYTLGTQAER